MLFAAKNAVFSLLVMLYAPPLLAEVPAVYADVTGQVEISKSCGKATFADMKLLVTAERAINYRRDQVVPIGPDGRFEVSLHQSYNYRFALMSGATKVGTGRFEPRYPDRTPVIIAHCSEQAKPDPKAAAKPAEKPAEKPDQKPAK